MWAEGRAQYQIPGFIIYAFKRILLQEFVSLKVSLSPTTFYFIQVFWNISFFALVLWKSRGISVHAFEFS